MRNDFSKKVKETLCSRVGGLCSICRCQTRGAQSKPDGMVSIGEAAHITAAEINGPRFDPSLSDEERSGIENGIWLCANCHKKIDSDPEKYTVQLLYSMKNKAENEATSSCGASVSGTEEKERIDNSTKHNINIKASPEFKGSDDFLAEDKVFISNLRGLGRCIVGYQDILDYAYKFWELSFKNKYDGYDLQNEIDENFDIYKSSLQHIRNEFNRCKTGVNYYKRAVSYEIKEELFSFLEEYSNTMEFSYKSDGIGIVDTYWMEFFNNLEKMYKRICELKGLIDSEMRREMHRA